MDKEIKSDLQKINKIINRIEKRMVLLENVEYVRQLRKRKSVNYSMFTDSGNRAVHQMLVDVCEMILDGVKREYISKILTTRWNEIASYHKEIFDTAVRETIFWYLDICTEYKKIIDFNYTYAESGNTVIFN